MGAHTAWRLHDTCNCNVWRGICWIVFGADVTLKGVFNSGQFLLTPYSDCLRAGWSGGRIPVRASSFAPFQTGSPSLLYSGYLVFPGGKAAVAWIWPPTPHQGAEFKERVELNLHFPPGPSWAVIVWTVPYTISQNWTVSCVICSFCLMYGIFVNCSWVVTRWQYTFTHKTIHRTIQKKQYIEQHNNFGRMRAVPRLG